MIELTPEETLTLATYNRQAERWSSNHSNSNFWEDEIAHFKDHLPAGRILEIGAGGGRDAKVLIDAGYEYLGTDISEGLLAQARLNNPGVSFEQVSVYDLDYEELFDGFWCSAVLLHIPRDRIDKALQAIHRNMKKGAVGFIAIKEGQGEKLETDDASTQSDERFFVYWTNDSFKEKLLGNGFEIVEEGYRPMSARTRWLTYIVKVEDVQQESSTT